MLPRLRCLDAKAEGKGNRNGSQFNRHANKLGCSCFSDKREDLSYDTRSLLIFSAEINE